MNRIMSLADSLVKTYQTRNPFTICEELEIYVIFTDLPESVRGFYQCIDGCRLIYLNNRLDENTARIVCAHELAHALIHSDYNVLELLQNTFFCCPKYEREADAFCACLLIDKEEADACRMDTLCTEQIAALSGVPVELVEMRYAGNF